MDETDLAIRGTQRINHTDFGDLLTLILASVLHFWFEVKYLQNIWMDFHTFSTDIYGPLGIISNHFSDSLTFILHHHQV